ncbi:MAG: GNAT family N-acetyltransferase [Ilumatobacteraceae bacterium]|nr:GNAT family N-acetyltransferase [Ilumatobacteraceae bacterium]
MTNEADRLALSRPGADAPLLLHGAGCTARVRPWPFQPDVAHLVLLRQARLPTPADLERWEVALRAVGYSSVRTGAVGAAAAGCMERAGYHIAQELVLLQHDDPRTAGHDANDGFTTRRLTGADDPAASEVDCAAFGGGWQLDAAAIDDVRHATPRHRARGLHATAGQQRLDGYAITGRDARQGFLQRLAVHPSVQGRGAGRHLVADSLHWLARWRVQRVLVNTPTGNDRALALYLAMGFHRLPERLRVYERSLA